VGALTDRGLKTSTIGVDESNLAIDSWTAMVEALPQARVVRGAALFRNIRMVKTEEEINRIARATEITEQGIQHVFECAEVGVTERELAHQFKARVSELGGDPAFWVLSAGGRTAHTHPRQSTYAIKPGDLLKLDMGCTYRFYWSDVGRTKGVGEPDERAQRIYETLCGGLRAAIDHVRPGVRSSEVFDAAVETIRACGLPDYQRHHCGHGIGINVYDEPLIRPAGCRGIYTMGVADPKLEVGMVINVETPYYLLGEYGFIVEDTVVVREDGPQLLTHLDYSFIAGE
jgi:Xaa-Pro aminopeptidase